MNSTSNIRHNKQFCYKKVPFLVPLNLRSKQNKICFIFYIEKMFLTLQKGKRVDMMTYFFVGVV